jgi:hypothetical protein
MQKFGRQAILKPTAGNETLYQDNTDNGVRTVNFATSKTLVVKSTKFPHRNTQKYTCTSPDGQTHTQIDDILTDRRWHLCVLDVPRFKGAECHTHHHLVAARVRERLAVSKQAAQKFDVKRFNFNKLSDLQVRNCIRLRFQAGLQVWGTKLIDRT